MSKHNHNYSQYSAKKPNGNAGVAAKAAIPNGNNPNQHAPINKPMQIAPVESIKPAEPVAPVKVVEETVQTVALPETVPGAVIGCAKLNVRAEASLFADIVCVLDTVSEFEIDVNKSIGEWFYIYTATGAEGYCMRKFVKAHM